MMLRCMFLLLAVAHRGAWASKSSCKAAAQNQEHHCGHKGCDYFFSIATTDPITLSDCISYCNSGVCRGNGGYPRNCATSCSIALIKCGSGYYCTDNEMKKCPVGSYCSGDALNAVSGPCDAGRFCSLGATTSQGQGSCSDAGNWCEDGTGTISGVGGICPEDHYCPAGATSPIKCANGCRCVDGSPVSCPEPCPAGHFCDASGYQSCPKGHYCPEGSAAPLPCDAGCYCPEESSTSCGDGMCSPGFYCASSGDPPQPCDPGYSCPAIATVAPKVYNVGQNNCGQFKLKNGDACQRGQYGCACRKFVPCSGCTDCSFHYQEGYRDRFTYSYTDETVIVTRDNLDSWGAYLQIKCNTRYTAGETVTTRKGIGACPAGWFCNGLGAPQPCPAGTWSSKIGATTLDQCDQRPCDAGRKCIGGDSTSRGSGVCDAGYICNAGQPPIECEKGTFCLAGTTNPTPCSLATYGPRAKAVSLADGCYGCPPGKAGNGLTGQNSEAAACEECDLGRFSSSFQQHSCDPCPDGTVAGRKGAFQCILCDGGSVPNEDKTSCTTCAEGTSAGPGAAQCKTCDGVGEYAPKGSSLCSVARAGHKPSADRSSEEMCSESTFSLPSANDECTECNQGSYSEAGSSTCATCVAGTFYNKSKASCQRCPASTYSLRGGLSLLDCRPCSGPGEFSSEGSAFCSIARAGHRPGANRTWEEPCPLNTISLGGVNECTPCPDNGHTFNTGAFTCKVCNGGMYFDQNLNNCALCPAGTFSTPGSTRCNDCPPGTYTEKEGMAHCTACPKGTFGNYKIAQISTAYCTKCEQGRWSSMEGLKDRDECVQCMPGKRGRAGYYVRLTEPESCENCTDGTFADKPGQVACKSCPSGQSSYSPWTFCATCPGGTRLDAKQNKCLECDEGTFARAGEGECFDCIEGRYSNNDRSECLLCPPGKFGNTSRSSSIESCYACEIGRYTDVVGGTKVCNLCPQGRHGRKLQNGIFPGQGLDHACQVCEPGYYAVTLGSSKCSPCPPGSYATVAGSKTCNLCKVKYYCDGVALRDMEECPRGSQCPSEGLIKHQLCPKDTYQDLPKQVKCKSCATVDPQSSTFSVIGSTSSSACVVCPPGGQCDSSLVIHELSIQEEAFRAQLANGTLASTQSCPAASGAFAKDNNYRFPPDACLCNSTFDCPLLDIPCHSCPSTIFLPCPHENTCLVGKVGYDFDRWKKLVEKDVMFSGFRAEHSESPLFRFMSTISSFLEPTFFDVFDTNNDELVAGDEWLLSFSTYMNFDYSETTRQGAIMGEVIRRAFQAERGGVLTKTRWADFTLSLSFKTADDNADGTADYMEMLAMFALLNTKLSSEENIALYNFMRTTSTEYFDPSGCEVGYTGALCTTCDRGYTRSGVACAKCWSKAAVRSMEALCLVVVVAVLAYLIRSTIASKGKQKDLELYMLKITISHMQTVGTCIRS